MKHLLVIVLAAYLTSFSAQSMTEGRTIIKRYPDLTTCLKAATRLQAGILFPIYQCIESDVELPITPPYRPVRGMIEGQR